MANNEREKFWVVLKNLHNNDESSMSMLTEASKRSETLCRFRPVSEHSLTTARKQTVLFLR